MSETHEARLAGELAAAEATVARLRTENAELAEAFRAEPSDAGREGLKRAAASLAEARPAEAPEAALEGSERTGTEHGLVADGEGRRIYCDGSSPALDERSPRARPRRGARASSPAGRRGARRHARAAPGPLRPRAPRARRRGAGTVLDVAGRVEGDVLLPAVARAAKAARRS